ncbi:cytochrome b5-like heme/steroid binding domain-containing protein [Fimicolochytrium jonesii]|uniref:cytochrome b5-like heme/steroid binding domain-containing protein n=1 Tax=Fimicolochytrium jonesii TaxID=1396493 RepID=UPI0022FE10C4|nr:cytochrome b5-like heme/steroid binding domain-containing protein [Fimicolochytrium jonesii]KAI8817949.1 cytochrome b5-like heme/steroid binding domain-containing protein [Fimicolochytrium jonesii]
MATAAAATIRTVEWSELAAHNTRDDLWIVVDGKVYDCTKFLDEHPGGEEVIVEVAGQDASEAFEEIGHSDDARQLLETLLVGRLPVSANPYSAAAKTAAHAGAVKDALKPKAKSSGATTLFSLVPIVVVIAFGVYKYLEKQHSQA